MGARCSQCMESGPEAQLPAHGTNAVQSKKSVVCIGGLASAALEVKRHDEDRWRPSYCHISALLGNPKRFLEELKLRLVEDAEHGWVVEDAEGVEVRPFHGIEGLARLNPDEHLPPVNVWHGLTSRINDDYELTAMNYDWRKWGCPRYSQALPAKLKIIVEECFVESGKQVTIIVHSMGGAVILYCLGVLGAHWQKKHIDELIMVAPAPMGSVTMVPSFAFNPVSATTAFFHAPKLIEHGLAETTCAWACMVGEMPMRVGGIDTFPPNKVFVKTSTKEYGIDEMGEFLDELAQQHPSRDFGSKLWPSVQHLASKMKAPAVHTTLIFNDTVETMASLEYSAEDGNLSTPPKVLENLLGDGTIISSTVQKMGETWREAGAPVTIINTPDKEDHKGLIAGKYTVDTVLKILAGEEVDDRLSF